MEVDANSDDTDTPTSTEQLLQSVPVEPVLKTSLVIACGRITCAICFQSSTKKHRKDKKFEEVSDIEKFKARAIRWTEYQHDYSTIFAKLDWPSTTKLHAHKHCKSNFFKDTVMSRQQLKSFDKPQVSEVPEVPSSSNIDENEDCIGIPRRSTRRERSYSSSLTEAKCIICTDVKKDSTTGRVLPVTTMTLKNINETMHQTEKKLIEFATVHVEKKKKYAAAGDRIRLALATSSSLFAANVGYHLPCYHSFRSPTWKKEKPKTQNDNDFEKTAIDELINLTEYLIVVRKEVYTLNQLRELFAEIKEVKPNTLRSADVKKIIEEKLAGKINFCRPTHASSSNTTEYVVSSDTYILPDAIHAINTGEGITNHLQLRAIARSIATDVQSFPKRPWPPTPQVIIESSEMLDKRLYNLVAWIVSPNSYVDKNGFVSLPPRKATKVSEICHNIQSLVPGRQPTLGQILLSLTMYAKTGSKSLVNDLKQLGHGLSYTETLFVQDIWAEWEVNQKLLVPSNMIKGVIATHVFDNIDWKNKNIQRAESHHTNSILVQKYDVTDELSKVTLEANYDFSRKDHRSFKGTAHELPSVYFKRGTVKKLKYVPSNERGECNKSSMKTLVWVESRIQDDSSQKIPAWSGFQELTTEPDLERAVVGYLPPIPDTPTEMKVIYAEIYRTERIRIELDINFIFIEADQAIYTKVIDAMFKLENEGKNLFKSIIPRMGGFHIAICMLRTIYSLYQNSGLVQILSSAGLGGLGTIKKALKGGDVNEAIRLHKKLFEAILRTKIAYVDILQAVENNEQKKSVLEKLKEEVNINSMDYVLNSNVVKPLPNLQGDMAWFMNLYCEMVDMMLNYIHFLRTGNWNGYLEVLFEFLPYCFRLNRHNYARNLSYYYVHMRSLKEENYEAYQYLQNGGFSGSLTGIPHSRIPFDHIIEMTINRQCKDVGGIGGNTENPGATERWVRINHLMAAMREHLNRKIGKITKRKHIELGASRMERDERDVRNIQSCLETWLPQMWNPDQPITNIATGMKATQEMKEDIIDIKERGEEARNEFIDRFTTEGMKETYYDPIKRQEIKLFKVKDNKKKHSIPADESQSFTEIFATFDQKKLDMRKIMNYCVTSRPWALINEDEKSRQNRKSDFRNQLQKMSPVPKTSKIPVGIKSSIVDAMRLVRMIPVTGLSKRTFRCWAEQFVKVLSVMPGDNLHVVFDNYKYPHNVPSKSRGESHVERVINDLDQELPPSSEWDDFLRNAKNKFQLVNLLADYIKSGAIPEKNVYVNKESSCFFKGINSSCVPFHELDSKHKEADQMIPLHAVFAGRSSDDTVCVISDDTDIYISLLYISHLINATVFFRQGKRKDKDGITYNDIHALANELGPDNCEILLCFHALTGSDYTYPFFNRSKIQSFRKMLKTPNSYKLLQTLLTDSPDVDEVTKFVLRIIYNRPPGEKTPGEARYKMLTTKGKGTKKFPSSKCLPPDQSSLKMKVFRAAFVTHVMSNCLDASYQPLDPSHYGWKIVEDIWEPVWYEGNPLPDPNGLEDVSDDEEDVNDPDDTVNIDYSEDEFSDDSDYVESCADSDTESETEE